MQGLFSKNFNNANKALSIIIVFLIVVLGVLVYFLAIKLTNNQDLVANDTQKAYAMDNSDDNTGGIPIRNTNNNDWVYPSKSCRYVTGGGHCARSEFSSGCNPGPNQICVCAHNNPNDIPKAGNYTYGDTQHRSIDEYTDCGAPNVNERNRVCQALASGQNPGANYNVQDSGNVWIVRGVAPACQNPYRFDCPKPTNTPTPAPNTGTLSVEARCVDNPNERVSVWVQIWRNDPYRAFNQGYTRLTLQTVDVPGITYGVTFIDHQTDGTRGFPALQRRYPNARFDGFEVSTGSFSRISPNEITGVSFNATVTLNFRGCVNVPTPPPSQPPQQDPVCNNITVTNTSKNNATCTSSNPQACNVSRGDNLRITVNGTNGNSYAISQTENLNNNQSRSTMSLYQSTNEITTSIPNDSTVNSVEIRGYVKRNDIVAPDNPNCRIIFNLPIELGYCSSMTVSIRNQSLTVNANTQPGANVIRIAKNEIPWGGQINLNSQVAGNNAYQVGIYWMRPYVEDPNDPINQFNNINHNCSFYILTQPKPGSNVTVTLPSDPVRVIRSDSFGQSNNCQNYPVNYNDPKVKGIIFGVNYHYQGNWGGLWCRNIGPNTNNAQLFNASTPLTPVQSCTNPCVIRTEFITQPIPQNPVCNNITITNISKNNATCTSSNPQACNVSRGDNLRVTVNGTNGNSYAISQLVRNNDGTSLSSITPYQSSNQFNTNVTNATNLSRLEIVGYVSNGTRNVTNDSTCRIAFDFAPVTTPTPSPSISIQKTLISPNFQPVNSTITFGITVTNTGNVDITDFDLIDEYDPEYLRLERAYVNRQDNSENLQPNSSTQVNANGRVRNQVTWTNLPVGSQPLLRGQSYTLYLDFRILREISANVALENDNCGVVSRITYRSGNQDISNTIQNVRDCAEFNTRTPNQLRAEITKRVLNSPVNIGSELRFEAILTNNDSESRSYDDIDFRDAYDTNYLRPRQVEVFKGDRRALVTSLSNTGIITINNVQDLIASDGNRLGGLNRGESYRFIIVFEAINAIDNTCDTVSASVRNNSQNVGGNTNEARACGQIIAPRPPKTGVNLFWSLIVPTLNIAGSLFVRNFLLRKFSKN